MKVDEKFAARVSELAAKIVCDGWPYGTFDDPESTLPVGTSVGVALQRAAHEVWGGPGWWRTSMSRAETCLQSILWQVCEDQSGLSFFDIQKKSRARWQELGTEETVIMLLLAAQALRERPDKAISTED